MKKEVCILLYSTGWRQTYECWHSKSTVIVRPSKKLHYAIFILALKSQVRTGTPEVKLQVKTLKSKLGHES